MSELVDATDSELAAGSGSGPQFGESMTAAEWMQQQQGSSDGSDNNSAMSSADNAQAAIPAAPFGTVQAYYLQPGDPRPPDDYATALGESGSGPVSTDGTAVQGMGSNGSGEPVGLKQATGGPAPDGGPPAGSDGPGARPGPANGIPGKDAKPSFKQLLGDHLVKAAAEYARNPDRSFKEAFLGAVSDATLERLKGPEPKESAAELTANATAKRAQLNALGLPDLKQAAQRDRTELHRLTQGVKAAGEELAQAKLSWQGEKAKHGVANAEYDAAGSALKAANQELAQANADKDRAVAELQSSTSPSENRGLIWAASGQGVAEAKLKAEAAEDRFKKCTEAVRTAANDDERSYREVVLATRRHDEAIAARTAAWEKKNNSAQALTDAKSKYKQLTADIAKDLAAAHRKSTGEYDAAVKARDAYTKNADHEKANLKNAKLAEILKGIDLSKLDPVERLKYLKEANQYAASVAADEYLGALREKEEAVSGTGSAISEASSAHRRNQLTTGRGIATLIGTLMGKAALRGIRNAFKSDRKL